MKKSLIVTSDPHLTDNPRDAHRWELFPWLTKQADKYGADIAILGDLTDAKDRHSAVLANLMADNMAVLAINHQVYILRANHDCVDPNEPFFHFLNYIEDVHFINEPEMFDKSMVLLPHARNWEEDWASAERWFPEAEIIFCHQTFDGAKAENGTSLKGLSPSIFGNIKAPIYSGDIHVPQVVSKRPRIEYVGAPYRVRFGDMYTPRVLLIKPDLGTVDLHFPTKNKIVVELNNISFGKALEMGESWGFKDEVHKHDQVKVRVHLSRRDFALWPELKAEVIETAKRRGLELTGPELIAIPDENKGAASESSAPSQVAPGEALAAYGKRQGLSKGCIALGEEFLKDAL